MTVTGERQEPTVAIDGAIEALLEWRKAAAEYRAAKLRCDEIAEQFKATFLTLGAVSGSVNGTPVVSCRPTATFRRGEFVRERPDLVGPYSVERIETVIDVDALKRDHPEIHRKYLSTQLRPNWEALDAAIGTKTETSKENEQ